jgi:hypothetical protein
MYHRQIVAARYRDKQNTTDESDWTKVNHEAADELQ